MSADRSALLRRELAAEGINLFAVLDSVALPEAAVTALRQADIPLADYRRLLLLGNAGPGFWQRLHRAGRFAGRANPIDEHSRWLAEQICARHLPGHRRRLLYPGPLPLPLQQLGALAGWHHPSPLGLGIHPQYGLWFAYRAALLTDAELTPTPRLQAASPCDGCADKPCVGACPVSAVSASAAVAFDLNACVDWRLQPGSSCRAGCAARLACPAGAEWRYAPDQTGYHARRSLAALQAWRAGKRR